MPNISAWPNDAAACSLSQVLEQDSIHAKYFLSAKACAGILRRAEARERSYLQHCWPPWKLRPGLQMGGRLGVHSQGIRRREKLQPHRREHCDHCASWWTL